MRFDIRHGPTFSTLDVELNQGDRLMAQPNTMLAMSPDVELTAKAGANLGSRGLFSGLKGVLSGESFFTTVYTAQADDQFLSLAPAATGDILRLNLDEEGGTYLTRGAYMASTDEVDLSLSYGGLRGFLSKKGLFLLHARGTGPVFCASYGEIVRRELTEGEQFVIDNRFVIAFSDSTHYELVKATRTLKDSFMSGEGFVNRYTGPGKLYYQTRGRPKSGILGQVFEAAT